MALNTGDALDRELASFKETVALTNPLTHGIKCDWKTTAVFTREVAQQEAAFIKTLPTSFVLTEPRQSLKAFKVAADAAKSPVQPLRPHIPLSKIEGSAKSPADKEHRDVCTLALQKRELSPSTMVAKRVPTAKRTHMDGVLHGIPTEVVPTKTTTQDKIVYTDEMQTMNRDKDTSFHRKRDAYSEYVEARARFSKMHSVN